MGKRKKFDWRRFWLFALLITFFDSRRYKGDRSHLKGASGFFVDLLCILCLTSLAAVLVSYYEQRDRKRAAGIAAGTGTSSRSNAPGDARKPSAVSSMAEQEKASAVSASPKEKQAASGSSSAGTGTVSMTEGGNVKSPLPVHTMPTAEERRQELAWQAQQAALEAEKQQTKAAEASRKAEADRRKREKLRLAAADAIAHLNEQHPDFTAASESKKDSGISVSGKEAYCGRIYVSRLMDFDDAEQAFCVPVPGESLEYSICWGSVPASLRGILKEYCAAGGVITAKTEKDWMNEAAYKLWVSLYLE